jgi:hypothetical protein
MFPAQLTGWTEAARAAAAIEARRSEERPEDGGEPPIPRLLSAGLLGTIAGLAACAAVGMAAWAHVNL